PAFSRFCLLAILGGALRQRRIFLAAYLAEEAQHLAIVIAVVAQLDARLTEHFHVADLVFLGQLQPVSWLDVLGGGSDVLHEAVVLAPDEFPRLLTEAFGEAVVTDDDLYGQLDQRE